jgi:hypothetical protein
MKLITQNDEMKNVLVEQTKIFENQTEEMRTQNKLILENMKKTVKMLQIIIVIIPTNSISMSF